VVELVEHVDVNVDDVVALLGLVCEALDDHFQHRLQVCIRVKALDEVNESLERGDVVLVRERLDDAQTHVLLDQRVLADVDDVCQAREQFVLLLIQVDAVDVGQPGEVVTDDSLQVAAVVLICRVVLHADPQSVHLLQIREDEVHREFHVLEVDLLNFLLREFAVQLFFEELFGGVEAARDRQIVLDHLVELLAHEQAFEWVLD